MNVDNYFYRFLTRIYQLYSLFSEEFYGSDDVDMTQIRNLKKYKVENAVVDDYLMQYIIPRYIQSLNRHQELVLNIMQYQCGIGVECRCRIKLRDTIYKKLNYNCSRSRSSLGSLYVNKVLNDLFGMRIVVQNLNKKIEAVKRYLDYYSQEYSYFKYYVRRKNGYSAVHCYFQTSNRYFPWELQIWDIEDKETNILAHEEHERCRENF